MGSKLDYLSRLSRGEANDKICAHAMYGAHMIEPRPKTRQEVEQFYLSRDASPDTIAETCRDFRRLVPVFENALGATWTVTSGGRGGKVEVIDNVTGRIEAVVDTDGVLSLSTYQSTLEAACRARDRAVATSSLEEYHSAVQAGLSSIEAFLQDKVAIWNHAQPKDQLIDSKQNKVSLQTKLDEWIPKMTGGRLDKSDQRWAHYKQLVGFRDGGVHPKSGGYGKRLAELAELINMFRTGVAGMHQQLHAIFRTQVPAVVINAFYVPDVVVVSESG